MSKQKCPKHDCYLFYLIDLPDGTCLPRCQECEDEMIKKGEIELGD